MSVVVSSLTQAPFGAALEAIEGFQGELTSVQSLLIAQRTQAGFSATSTETILKKSGKVSRAQAKKATKRAAAVEKNPGLANKLSSGVLSTEHVDLLAEASDKTDGEAADDEALISEIAGSNPDQGRKIVREYIEEHEDQGDRDSRYAQQRKRRKLYKTQGPNGMPRLVMEGDDHSIDQVLKSLQKRSDVLYRNDGGRDVPKHQHPRTRDQRLFDAAFAQIVGRLDETDTSTPSGPAQTADSSAPPANRPGERPVMVLRSNIADASDDPEVLAAWTAELIGSGLVPTTLASYYRCISDFAFQIVDDEGVILKHGRTKRRVTPEQWLAMVIRDQGCVQCGAHHTRCEAHHLKPWTSPAKGETNIDEMVLLCVDCHQRLHEANHTMFLDPNTQKWRTRPATPHETPARGPTRRAKPESRAASTPRPQRPKAQARIKG